MFPTQEQPSLRYDQSRFDRVNNGMNGINNNTNNTNSTLTGLSNMNGMSGMNGINSLNGMNTVNGPMPGAYGYDMAQAQTWNPSAFNVNSQYNHTPQYNIVRGKAVRPGRSILPNVCLARSSSTVP